MVREGKNVCPHWSGRCPTLTAAMSAKKRLLIGWRWPGGLGVDKTTHSPPFFPRLELEEEKEEKEEKEEEEGERKRS